MKGKFQLIVASLALGLAISQSASAIPVTHLAFKLSDADPAQGSGGFLDAYDGWMNTGGFNEGNATAQQLTNNGWDYKSSIVDTWPSNMTNVRVAFYTGGVEQAYIDFNPAGTTKSNFFTQANVTGSSWTDITGSGNFFSIPGHASINRHWFVNNNYGGCPSDVGQMVVDDFTSGGGPACNWEASRDHLVGTASRAFLYANAATQQNWNSSSIGVADTFAVHITTEEQQSGVVAEPSVLALLGLPLLGVAGMRRLHS